MQPTTVNNCQFLGASQHHLWGHGAEADGFIGYIALLEWISCHAFH